VSTPEGRLEAGEALPSKGPGGRDVRLRNCPFFNRQGAGATFIPAGSDKNDKPGTRILVACSARRAAPKGGRIKSVVDRARGARESSGGRREQRGSPARPMRPTIDLRVGRKLSVRPASGVRSALWSTQEE
jgi:hypothetical protein